MRTTKRTRTTAMLLALIPHQPPHSLPSSLHPSPASNFHKNADGNARLGSRCAPASAVARSARHRQQRRSTSRARHPSTRSSTTTTNNPNPNRRNACRHRHQRRIRTFAGGEAQACRGGRGRDGPRAACRRQIEASCQGGSGWKCGGGSETHSITIWSSQLGGSHSAHAARGGTLRT